MQHLKVILRSLMFASDQNSQLLLEQPSVSLVGAAEAGTQETGGVSVRPWMVRVEFRGLPESARGVSYGPGTWAWALPNVG